ncbi:MAG: type II toxin-antitoxin system HicB family antitoxin [bacterium]
MNQKTYHYTVHFEQAPDGVIIATVPALRGCVSYGGNLEEAEHNIQEAVECYLEGLQALGEEIPLEEHPAPVSMTKALTVSFSPV